MDYTNGYKWGGEIGGPMDLGHGYRWSVPIVTYAFDQSFLDSFGSNGVTAVEGGNRHSQSIAPGLQRRPYKLPSRDDQFWIAR